MFFSAQPDKSVEASSGWRRSWEGNGAHSLTCGVPSSPVPVGGFLLLRSLAKTDLDGNHQAAVQSPLSRDLFWNFWLPWGQSKSRVFLRFCVFYHFPKWKFPTQFLPRLLNKCASSVTESGNGLATPRLFIDSACFWSSHCLSGTVLGAGGTAEKKTEKNLSLHGADILVWGQMLNIEINPNMYPI